MLDPALPLVWYELLKWLLQKTETFPKRIRHTMTMRIENLALDILQLLTKARYASRKAEVLAQVDEKLDQLRLLLRLANDCGHLDHKGYQHVAERLTEVGRMLGGWRKQRARSEQDP